MPLDWSNERWVRVYTRDTTTWKLVDWRARTVLLHLFRKVDRAGVLDVGDDGEDGLAAVLELPGDIVSAGISQLVRRETVVATGTAYIIPNFLDAQEATSSDKKRQRESRERRRSAGLSVTNRDTASQIVTDRHERSHAVTSGHEVSQPVTPRQDKTNRDETREIVVAPEAPKQARRPRRMATAAPDANPEPSDADRAFAASRGVSLESEWPAMWDYHRARGKGSADWSASWRTWCNNAVRFAANRGLLPSARPQPANRGPVTASTIARTDATLTGSDF